MHFPGTGPLQVFMIFSYLRVRGFKVSGSSKGVIIPLLDDDALFAPSIGDAFPSVSMLTERHDGVGLGTRISPAGLGIE